VPGQSNKRRDRCRMSSIIRDGDTFHGISVFGRGVFTNDDDVYRWTYAGQCKDGHACGLGVVTYRDGRKEYAEYGPDGECDGRYLRRWTGGDTIYSLFERGWVKDVAGVHADGTCTYNGMACAPDDPRFLALIAQVAPFEVRPATRAPHPHSPPSNRPMDRPARFAPCRRWRPPWPPRCTPIAHAVAVRHNPTTGRTAKHDHAVTRARAFCRYGSHGRRVPSCTLTTAALCTPMGPSRQPRCHAIV
jgi:hypothetical protein